MKYSLERIIHNLSHNWFWYFLIMLNFMVGTGFFIISMNFNETSQELLKEAKRQSSKGIIQVMEMCVKDWEYYKELEDYSISYDTYLKLCSEEDMEELDVLFSMNYDAFCYISEYDQLLHTRVYFMNEKLFLQLYGKKQSPQVVYLGNEAYQKLVTVGEAVSDNVEIRFFSSQKFIKEDSLWINGKNYSYEVITPVESNTIMPNLMGETGDTMEDAIIFPIEETILPKSTNPDITVSTHTTLFFRYLKEEYQEDLVAKKLQILNAANKDYNFVVNDQYLELKRLMDDYRYDMDRWFLVAISILLLSGSGCMGMMVLFWDKRRHDIAVAIACGSTMKRIGAETIGELFLALMIGEFLGIGIVPLLENVVVYQEELYFNASGPIVVTVVAFGYSIISVWLGMRTLKEKDIALTLKEE